MTNNEANAEDIRQLRLQYCPNDNRPICIAIGEVIRSEKGRGVFNYLDLSTSHITLKDSQILAEQSESESNHLALSPGVGFRIVNHEYGWWISVPNLKEWEETEAEFKTDVIDAGFSPAFADMILHAMNLNCFWINLDKDGEELEGLETFVW